jgi:hypothetical protein
MNLRKLIYLPNRKHKKMMVNDIKTIMERCHKIAGQEYQEQKENQRAHDEICPRCRAMQDKIVDRIRSVEGEGKVDGDFYLGFGSVKGRMKIETEAVNYCKTCKNEWKKFNVKYVSQTDIVRVALNYLAEIIDSPAHNKRMTWKTEAAQVFDGCSAESIRFLRDKHKNYLRSLTLRTLKIRKLRKYYVSVFDGENNFKYKTDSTWQ